MRKLVVVVLWACLSGCQTGPSGPDVPPNPPATQPTPVPEGPLSGRWVGPTGEGLGISTYDETLVHNCAHTCVDYCRNFYDVEEVTLSHQGTRLTGTMISRHGGAECQSGSRFYRIPPLSDARITDHLNLTATASGGVSVAWADDGPLGGGLSIPVNQDLGGTYTANSITIAGEREETRGSTTETWSIAFRLRRP